MTEGQKNKIENVADLLSTAYIALIPLGFAIFVMYLVINAEKSPKGFILFPGVIAHLVMSYRCLHELREYLAPMSPLQSNDGESIWFILASPFSFVFYWVAKIYLPYVEERRPKVIDPWIFSRPKVFVLGLVSLLPSIAFVMVYFTTKPFVGLVALSRSSFAIVGLVAFAYYFRHVLNTQRYRMRWVLVLLSTLGLGIPFYWYQHIYHVADFPKVEDIEVHELWSDNADEDMK